MSAPTARRARTSPAAVRLATVAELFAFVWAQKRWWLVPMLLILVFTTVLLIFAETAGVGRFIYPGM